MRVSIIIPCHNQGKYVGRAIRSALSQTIHPYEIIVVDDASSDNTAAVTAQYPVTYIRAEVNSATAARTLGLHSSTGEAVILLDADNELYAPYVERHVQELELDDSVGWCYSAPYMYFEPGEDTGWYPYSRGVAKVFPFSPEQLAVFNYIDMCAMIRRQALRDIGDVFPEPNADYALWLALTEAGWLGKAVDEPLYLYRVHGGNMSRSDGIYARSSARPTPDYPIRDPVPQTLRDRHQRAGGFWSQYEHAGAAHSWWDVPLVSGNEVRLSLFARPYSDETVHRLRFVVSLGLAGLVYRSSRPLNSERASIWLPDDPAADDRLVAGLSEVPSTASGSAPAGIEITASITDQHAQPVHVSATPWWIGSLGATQGHSTSVDVFTL